MSTAGYGAMEGGCLVCSFVGGVLAQAGQCEMEGRLVV